MRLSTSSMYELGVAGVQRQQADQVELQQKISTGRRVLKPSDDPVAAAAAMNVGQAKALNEQYRTNAMNAEAALVEHEQALADAGFVLQDIRTLAVQAGNATLTNSARASLATELEGSYYELLGIANRTDGNGTYLFSGYKGTTQPFSESAPGVVTYAGDEGHRLLQIGPQRRIAISESGAEVFQRILNGNGTFVATPGSANSGTAVIGVTAVRSSTAWADPANNRDYTINFHVDSAVPPVTTYDIVDNVSGTSMLTGVAPAAGPHARVYTPGTAISLKREAGDPSVAPWDAGIAIDVSGAPATGDTLEIESAQVQDVFASVHELITSLRAGTTGGPASTAAYQNGLNLSSSNIDRALDQVLIARTSVGRRMQEIASVKETSGDLSVHYAADLSRLQDLDYAQALSDLTRNQVMLEAAQKSYVAITKLNLFDFL